jgi:predicted transposase YbfD/YdcC
MRQGNRMNAIVVNSPKYSLTIKELQRGCSQPLDLCSFLSFWSFPWRQKANRAWSTYLSAFAIRGKQRRSITTWWNCWLLRSVRSWQGPTTFVEIEAWATEKLDWLRRYLRLEQGIPSHDTFGRVFAAIDPDEFGPWRSGAGWAVLPVWQTETWWPSTARPADVPARSGATPLHLVSAFAAGAGLVLGQQATAVKSNEKTAIPELLATLALEGCIVTIDAMGTQPSIAQAIRDRGADYILSVKDNQPTLAESMRRLLRHLSGHAGQDTAFIRRSRREGSRPCRSASLLRLQPDRLPGEPGTLAGSDLFCRDCLGTDDQGQDHARIPFLHQQPARGCGTPEPLDSPALARREQRALVHGRRLRRRPVCARAPITPRTTSLSCAISPSICIRLAPSKRKGGLKVQRLIAATSDDYRAQILGLL